MKNLLVGAIFLVVVFQNCSGHWSHQDSSLTENTEKSLAPAMPFAPLCSKILQPKWNIAHRGNESEFLENTFPAFSSNLNTGAHFFELDVVMSKDQKLFVYHDNVLSRLLDCGDIQGKRVDEVDAAEIQEKCRYKSDLVSEDFRSFSKIASYPPQKMLSLFEVLSAFQHTPLGIFIEIKAGYPAHRLILDEIRKLDTKGLCLNSDRQSSRLFNCFRNLKIISFHGPYLDEIRQWQGSTYKDLKNIELFKLVGDQNRERLMTDDNVWSVDGAAFHANNLGATKEEARQLLETIHARYPCKRTFVYTIQNTQTLESLMDLSLTGIVNGIPRKMAHIQGRETLWISDNFMAGSVLDLGDREAPSNWFQNHEALHQTSNIWGGSSMRGAPHERGTYFLFGKGKNLLEPLINFELSVEILSLDNDGLGLIFDYQNPESFFAWEWDQQNQVQTLYTADAQILRQFQSAYESHTWYKLKLKRQNSLLQIWINENLSVDETAENTGGLAGFFTRGNPTKFRNYHLKILD